MFLFFIFDCHDIAFSHAPYDYDAPARSRGVQPFKVKIRVGLHLELAIYFVIGEAELTVTLTYGAEVLLTASLTHMHPSPVCCHVAPSYTAT